MRPDMHPYIHAQKNPEKPAYIMAGSGETVTYRQLDQQSNRQFENPEIEIVLSSIPSIEPGLMCDRPS